MRKKKRTGLKNTDKKADLTIKKLIIMILIAVAIVFGIYIFIYSNILGRFKSLLPDWITSGYSNPYGDSNCPEGVLAVASLDKDYYIMLDGVKTNIYLDPKNQKILLKGTGYINNEELGAISQSSQGFFLTFDPGFYDLQNSVWYKYRDKLPDQTSINKLISAQISGNLICKNVLDLKQHNSKKNDCINQAKDCKLYNGVCSASPISGSFIRGKVGEYNCQSDESCYIKESEEILNQGEFSFYQFSMTYENLFETVNRFDNLIGTNEFTSYIGEILVLQVGVKGGSDGYCYSFSSNNGNIKTDVMESSGQTYNEQKVNYNSESWIEFIAWNGDNKVLKRMKISKVAVPEAFNSGTIYTDDPNFKQKVIGLKANEVFFVNDLRHSFSPTIVATVYRITKLDNGRITIEIHDPNKIGYDNWLMLSCDGFFYKSILINDVEDTLKATLADKCSY